MESGTECKQCEKKCMTRVRDVLVPFTVLCVCGIMGLLLPPHERIFFENDPSLSFPKKHQSVPAWMLIIFVITAPIITWLMFLLLRHVQATRLDLTISFFRSIVFYLQVVALTAFFTEFLKSFCGRQRPNFFAMCDYKGYRDAILGNAEAMKAYLNETTKGSQGDLKYCRATSSDIKASQSSFPSGHSSSAFAAMTFVSLFYRNVLDFSRGCIWKAIIVVIPMIVACLLAESRTRDYYHNFSDVTGGAVIGIVCTWFLFTVSDGMVSKVPKPISPI